MCKLNSVQVLGNLTRDPQIRATKTGRAVASFSIAVNRSYTTPQGEKKELTDFINVVAWGTLAEAVGNQLKKGTRVFVEGRYATRSYEAQDGSRRYVTEVVANLIALPLGTHAQPGSSGTTADWSQFGTVEAEEPLKPKKPEYEMGTIPF
jgi:single-strand DNA-binding protein